MTGIERDVHALAGVLRAEHLKFCDRILRIVETSRYRAPAAVNLSPKDPYLEYRTIGMKRGEVLFNLSCVQRSFL